MAVLELASFEMLENQQNYLGKHQCVLSFGDEYELSIISGKGAFATESAPYEIAVLKHGNFVEMPGIVEGDSVRGYMTESDVSAVIKKMYFLTGKTPVQV